MKSIAILILLFSLPILKANAEVNYHDLKVEQRNYELKRNEEVRRTSQQASQETIDAAEQEKKLITQQLTAITGDEDTRYTIVVGDTLKVTYKDQNKLVTNVYQVNGEGEIAMPLIGNTKVVGMNRGDARAHLNELLTEYIRDPQLTVDVNTSGKYTVVGAAGPGVFPLEPDLSLMDAILRAGYDAHRANISAIFVMRGDREKPQILRLNIKKMMVKGDRSDNIIIKPNDLIYVPNTLFYDADTFKDKVFDYIADYYTLGGATIIKQRKPSSNGALEP
jgi:polysaccharide export outer membrane protein